MIVMSNEAGPFPPGYDPKQEAQDLITDQSEARQAREQEFVEIMDAGTSYIEVLKSVSEFISREWHSVSSPLDKQFLSEFYHKVQNEIGLADNVRRYYGKTLDGEKHGEDPDLSLETAEQQQLIVSELDELTNMALDPGTKQLLEETIEKLRNRF